MEPDFKKSLLTDVVKAGVILGVILFLIQLLSAVMHLGLNGTAITILNLLGGAVIAVGSWYFCKERALIAAGQGYSYGQCLGFIVLTGVVASVVAALGDILLVKAMPEYFLRVAQASVERSQEWMENYTGLSSDMIEESLDGAAEKSMNPFRMFFGGVFGTAALFTFLGLFVSIFVKTQPDPFYEENPVKPEQE